MYYNTSISDRFNFSFTLSFQISLSLILGYVDTHLDLSAHRCLLRLFTAQLIPTMGEQQQLAEIAQLKDYLTASNEVVARLEQQCRRSGSAVTQSTDTADLEAWIIASKKARILQS